MRPLPRIKFIWGAGKVIRGRWYLGLFGFYDRVEGEPDSGLAISVRGVAGWGACAAAIVYVAGASVLHSIWQKNPYNTLTWSDAVLYPVRRAEIAEKKGKAFIAQGQAFFLEKKYQDAANLLRLGLARYPRDLEARITLSQFYLLANQRATALNVLVEGLKPGEYPGRRYAEKLLDTAVAADDFGRVVELTRVLQATKGAELEQDRRWLLERAFAALSALERHEDALALAAQQSETDTTREQRVIALLALGRTDETLRVLAEARTKPKANRAVITRLSARVYRETKRYGEMDQALAELRALAPSEPGPLVFAVVQRAMAGRADDAAAALEDYLFRFGGDATNLLLVAEPLAEIRNVVLLERCLAAAQERGYPLPRFQSLLVQARAFRGEWDAAARALAAIVPPPQEPLAGVLWREWMGKLIEAGRTPTDAAQLALVEFLRQRPWPAKMFRQTSEALRDGGRSEGARDVLAVATRVFPGSAWFRDEAANVQERLAAAAPVARAAPQGASLDAEALAEEAYWTRLDALMGAKRWTEAGAHVQALRATRPAPDWLARREADLRLAQVRIGHALGDKTAMVSAARLYLNGDEHRAQHVVTIASEVADLGDRDNALALVREVLRRTPDFGEGKALLAKLQPAE